MGTKISSQLPALTGQSAADAMMRNEAIEKPAEDFAASPQKSLDTSYEVNLSDKAQSLLSSAPPGVSAPNDAQTQMNLIKLALQQSPATFLNSHKPNAQTVIDLLA